MHDLGAAQRQQEEAAARRVASAADTRARNIEKIRKGPTRKVIGTEDFLGVAYLESGVAAARAVGRVVIRENGDLAGYGTGSLVSPTLLLTNNHVLASADVAEGSTIEFGYQDGDGRPAARSAHLRARSRAVLPHRRGPRLRARRREGDT